MSLRRLRLERLELFQLHRIDPNVPAEDQFGLLRDLQREGKFATSDFPKSASPKSRLRAGSSPSLLYRICTT